METVDVGALLEVLTRVQKGDFSARMPLDWTGVPGKVADTLNAIIDQQAHLVEEFVRVGEAVGKEGRLEARLGLGDARGQWAVAANAANGLIEDLARPTREAGRLFTAMSKGDLSQRMAVEVDGEPLRGELARTAGTVNALIEQLDLFAREVTRVATEVGIEGRLGGQAEIPGVSGTWKDLTDSVNLMASNLTAQVRSIAEVTTAVARGDLNRKITIEVRGEVLELRETINKMVEQLAVFASEVTRIARQVGSEGQLGGQAEVPGVSGIWKDLTDNVNLMASNLTAQVRDIAEVTTAVARGDLSKKITIEARGEVLELKQTINTMTNQLAVFASEVTRLAGEVGSEGQLGGQADVPGVSGTWRDLTDNVNLMASNLTSQVRNIAEVATAVAMGNLDRKITVEARGEVLRLKETINVMVDRLAVFSREVTRLAREVGIEGRLGGQANVPSVSGTWKDLTDNVNQMAANLTEQVRGVSEVTTAVANGDLSSKITIEAQGELLRLRETVNTMVDRLAVFASEVTRLSREVGSEGQLGVQAKVPGVSGVWRELTDNVNLMASNLTAQVRGIARVVTAVAEGDLRQRLTLQAKGEIATLAETVNDMSETLRTFSEQVTMVAREVGVEGRLGGQADVPGAQGIWRDLTDNVNQLAGNLTSQVRAIGEVATAVAEGDLTRAITVEAHGEVSDLKDNVNRMIVSLRETTRLNEEQDWLKTNLTRFSRLVQGQRDQREVARQLLSELAPLIHVEHGIFYIMEERDKELALSMIAAYAFAERKHLLQRIRPGEGLVGQCVIEKGRILLTQVPPDYVKIRSALGEATPLNVVVLPILFEERVLAVIELASFQAFVDIELSFLDQLADGLGTALATIVATSRTEDALQESQSLTEELQKQQEELRETNLALEQQTSALRASEEALKQQQEELQRSNEELEDKAELLRDQKIEVEKKNHEVEEAGRRLTEKAEQLALTSKYKSEFLANMSHELRTPLNSLLILSQILVENRGENLTREQLEQLQAIHGSGSDLLGLINEVLDLSKIEAGAMDVRLSDVRFNEVAAFAERSFRQVAEDRGLDFGVTLDGALASGEVRTDEKRLQQILRNLLANAFKFTEAGQVELRISPPPPGYVPGREELASARAVVAFAIRDSGIGIPPEHHLLIFEAFQQVDGSTSRPYGGTGLGLPISRELAHLLGGEIRLESSVGEGSVFTLYLPVDGPPGEGASGRQAGARGGGARRGLAAPRSAAGKIDDDRLALAADERLVCIIEDDPAFARVLLELARGRGFKGVVASEGAEGLALVRSLRPDAVTLDLRLPDTSGWAILDQLKRDPETRHIPVHIISVEPERQRGLSLGAMAYLEKPVKKEDLEQAFAQLELFLERDVRRLLVVEDDETQRRGIVELIGNGDVVTTAVATGKAALAALAEHHFDCMVVDLKLPDMSGLTLIDRIRKQPELSLLPIIVYTGKDLNRREANRLRKLAEAVVVKGVRSPERLLDETTLFLHRVEASLSEGKQRILDRIAEHDPILAGRKVLVVDDDVRNIFAITSALENREMVVLHAENGRLGVAALEENPDVDLVLMDIMMPEMDGYEATRAIRAKARFAKLPVIALTAKAMQGDREKCIEAGASDYIGKPVNLDQLLSLLRVWLYRPQG